MGCSDIMPYVGLDEVKDWKGLLKALLAEFMGTMFLVLFSCGAAIQTDDMVRISLCFGLTVASMAQAIGHISGCHINPGVTSGLIVGGKIGVIKGLLYIAVQSIGGIVGAAILKAVSVPEIKDGDKMVPNPIGNVGALVSKGEMNAGQGFAIEFFIVFALVLVVFAAACDDFNAPNVKGSAPLAIGLAVVIGHLFAADKTGCGMNPARALGPAVVTGDFQNGNHWIYWVGPMLGGAAAAIVYQIFFQAPSPTSESRSKNEF